MHIDEVAAIFRASMTRLVAEAAVRNQRRQVTAKKAPTSRIDQVGPAGIAA